MTDSEITTTILRQIRDGIQRLDARLDETNTRIDGLDQRGMVVEHILRDVHGQVLVLIRHVKKQDGVVDDVRKRVTKLEKKGS
ncbi:MAG TPA: hypothetical protein VIV40_04140 [Kofleriaceae bacterium]